jgi:hypothetical protein
MTITYGGLQQISVLGFQPSLLAFARFARCTYSAKPKGSKRVKWNSRAFLPINVEKIKLVWQSYQQDSLKDMMAANYKRFLAERVLNEQQTVSKHWYIEYIAPTDVPEVTYRSLSQALKVHSNLAKQYVAGTGLIACNTNRELKDAIRIPPTWEL